MKLMILNLFVVLYFLTSCKSGVSEIEQKPDPSEDVIAAPEEWRYLDGDEFNESNPKASHWKLYGAVGVGNAAYGQGNQQMLQTYRPEQVMMTKLETGERICRIVSIKASDAPVPMAPSNDKPGWWSGALSSREADKFYPLYCRMEIRAKAPNVEGVWHAFWNRFFQGASVAELDMQEFFVTNAGPNVLSQATHLFNSTTNKTDTNVPVGMNRNTPLTDPQNVFHVYGVQVDPDPQHPDEAIISYLLDGKVTISFSTHSIPGHNKFILEAKKADINKAWDMAITGQIGGQWVGFPAANVIKVVTEIDWFRCFVRK
jgi:hypothetical protein